MKIVNTIYNAGQKKPEQTFRLLSKTYRNPEMFFDHNRAENEDLGVIVPPFCMKFQGASFCSNQTNCFVQ